MPSKQSKKSLVDWASTAKPPRGGAFCVTCSWIEAKKEQKDSVVDELESVLQQIFRGTLNLSVAAVARQLKAEHGYRYTEGALQAHIRRCRPDLTTLKD